MLFPVYIKINIVNQYLNYADEKEENFLCDVHDGTPNFFVVISVIKYHGNLQFFYKNVWLTIC